VLRKGEWQVWVTDLEDGHSRSSTLILPHRAGRPSPRKGSGDLGAYGDVLPVEVDPQEGMTPRRDYVSVSEVDPKQ
jgi:hypothetical protein